MTTALTCHTLVHTVSTGTTGGAILEASPPAMRDAIAYASLDDMFIFGTPMRVFFGNRDPVKNPERENLFLTASNYATVLGVRDAYESRYAYTCKKFFGRVAPPLSDFQRNMFSEGSRMEEHALKLWNDKHKGRYVAKSSGMLLDEACPELFGGTPDALVFDWDTLELVGTLEIKYRAWTKTPSRARRLIPQRYLMQMIGQLMAMPFVYRWFYMEYITDSEYYAYHGRITESDKIAVRTELLKYKELVMEKDSEDKFPKKFPKNEKYDWDTFFEEMLLKED